MNVLIVSSEAQPFFAVGNLGEMAGGVGEALKEGYTDTRVILPFFGSVDSDWRKDLTFVTDFYVQIGWRSEYCGLYKTIAADVVYYFLDNDYYFNGERPCGLNDDAERFAFFSRAVLGALPVMGFYPDVINCHDWQTGIAPTYPQFFYKNLEKSSGVKTIFTIHDRQFQGQSAPKYWKRLSA